MSQDNSRLFDDLTRVAGGAASVFSALGKQLQAGMQDKKFGSNGSASDDVVRLQGVVTKLRLEQEDLKQRVAALEALVGIKKPAAKKAAPAKKVSASKTPAKKPAAKAKKQSSRKS
ncbi:MAG: hypothetical protein AAB276_03355 [Pseudomonadota bacterium]